MRSSRIGNDALSSIRIPRGCQVSLYEHSKYRGRSVTLDYDQADLGRTLVGNVSVSSITVNCNNPSYNEPSYGGQSPAAPSVPQSQMQRYCQGEASGTLNVKPNRIETDSVQQIVGGRFVVRGRAQANQYNATEFECTFDRNGAFEQVLVVSRTNDQYNNQYGDGGSGSYSAEIPQAARSMCLRQFGGGTSSRVVSTSALRAGFWEVIMEDTRSNRSVACTVTGNARIENWVELN